MCEYHFDLIIPTYKPGTEFFDTLRGLALQTIRPDHFFIINTQKQYWNPEYEKVYEGLSVKHIKKSEFNHGTTRYLAAADSKADCLVFMTQDAVPKNEHLFEELIAPVKNKEAAVSYARQITKEDADPIEKITREFNYPPKSRLKSAKDLKELGIKTFFCSNVCAAYDREIYEKLGGFVHPVDFNEDMIFAAKAIENGCKIAYSADAIVIHSHNYSAKEQYDRNFQVGRNQALYPEVFSKYPSEKEGIKLVKNTASALVREGKPLSVFRLVLYSGAKYLGYRAGKKSVTAKK